MSTQNVVLWRHGQTDYNLAMRLQGQCDVPLNATGREQAAHGAATIAAACTVGRIVSSDMSRALDTARALAALTRLPITADKRLRERAFGRLEGLTRAEIAQLVPVGTFARTTVYPAEFAVELITDVAARGAACVREQLDLTPPGTSLVVVAHGALLGVTLDVLVGLDPAVAHPIRGLNNAHYSTLVAEEGAASWQLTAHNLY